MPVSSDSARPSAGDGIRQLLSWRRPSAAPHRGHYGDIVVSGGAEPVMKSPRRESQAGHARPAGRARVPEATTSWLEEAGFRTALTASAAALLLIVAAAATALLMSAPGTAASAARNDPAGTARLLVAH